MQLTKISLYFIPSLWAEDVQGRGPSNTYLNLLVSFFDVYRTYYVIISLYILSMFFCYESSYTDFFPGPNFGSDNNTGNNVGLGLPVYQLQFCRLNEATLLTRKITLLAFVYLLTYYGACQQTVDSRRRGLWRRANISICTTVVPQWRSPSSLTSCPVSDMVLRWLLSHQCNTPTAPLVGKSARRSSNILFKTICNFFRVNSKALSKREMFDNQKQTIIVGWANRFSNV